MAKYLRINSQKFTKKIINICEFFVNLFANIRLCSQSIQSNTFAYKKSFNRLFEVTTCRLCANTFNNMQVRTY